MLLMVGLAIWMHRLQQSSPKPEADEPGEGEARLQPDGTPEPGRPEAVTFGDESCVPWHVSAAEQPPSPDSRYLILTSRVADPYGYTLTGFSQECGDRHRVLVVENTQPGQLAEAVAQRRPDALVTVGVQAVELAGREAPGIPLLYAMIHAPSRAGLDRPGAVGVLPWIPVRPMVRHLLRVLPRKHETVAVLHPPGRMEMLAREAKEAIEANGRKPLVLQIDGPQGLVAVLDKAADGADAWMVLLDRKIIDHQMFNKIQIAAENAKVPLCVPDEEHVRAGAYAGVGPDSHRVGRQLCRLAGALQRGRLPEGSRVFCPEYSFVAIHNAVVEKLGYILDPEQYQQAKLYKWH